MKYLLIFFIKIYRLVISPLKMPCCRFEPACSLYSIQAIKRYGAFKGLLLSFRRVLSCHPWSKGGYDPLP